MSNDHHLNINGIQFYIIISVCLFVQVASYNCLFSVFLCVFLSAKWPSFLSKLKTCTIRIICHLQSIKLNGHFWLNVLAAKLVYTSCWTEYFCCSKKTLRATTIFRTVNTNVHTILWFFIILNAFFLFCQSRRIHSCACFYVHQWMKSQTLLKEFSRKIKMLWMSFVWQNLRFGLTLTRFHCCFWIFHPCVFCLQILFIVLFIEPKIVFFSFFSELQRLKFVKKTQS